MHKKKILITSVVAASVAAISTIACLVVYTLHGIDNIDFKTPLTN